MGDSRSTKGRKKSAHEVGLSRQKFKCAVEDCTHMFRSDRLKEHYTRQVIWTEKGHNDPAPLYSHAFRSSTNELKRSHTKYSLDNGYTRSKMPKYIVVELPSKSSLFYSFPARYDVAEERSCLPASF